MTGLESSMRVGPIGPSPVGFVPLPSLPRALRSAPAQKVPPAPQSTAARVAGSASTARKASARARAVGPSTAFFLSGRSMMTVLTDPCCSTRTDMTLASITSAVPGLGARQIGIQGSPGRELGCGVRHPEIIHGERGLPCAPISLARVEVDFAPRQVREACAGARDVGLGPERHPLDDCGAPPGERIHAFHAQVGKAPCRVAHANDYQGLLLRRPP